MRGGGIQRWTLVDRVGVGQLEWDCRLVARMRGNRSYDLDNITVVHFLADAKPYRWKVEGGLRSEEFNFRPLHPTCTCSHTHTNPIHNAVSVLLDSAWLQESLI